MQSSQTHVFAGPSISPKAAQLLRDPQFVHHPPAKRGDIERLVTKEAPCRIVLADGVFHAAPAVGHAEIRGAVRLGVDFWGLCSIGALRAAEMRRLGVRGFGRVFEIYCELPMTPDDEVALLHSPEEPYEAISEPLLHIRAHIGHLEKTIAIQHSDAQHILDNLSSRWFGQRTVEEYAALLRLHCGYQRTAESLSLELANFRIKQQDLDNFLGARPWLPELTAPRSLQMSKGGACRQLDEIEALPFIDERAKPGKLLSAAVGVRNALAGTLGDLNRTDFASPDAAFALVESKLKNAGQVLPQSRPLTHDEGITVAAAKEWLIRARPEWAPWFQIPVIFLRWESERTSLTNPFIPQRIYLGNGALCSTFGILCETVLHEYAHVWLGLVTEIRDFQIRDCPVQFILPSGTGPKDARAVLFAMHYAATVVSFLTTLDRHERCAGWQRERLAYLRWYLSQIVNMNILPFLTPTGAVVFWRLRDYANELCLS